MPNTTGSAKLERGIRGLSLRQIDVFHAVYRTKSISAASRLLGISQPVVSRIIRRLEDILAISLFRRGGTGLMPTMEAQLIFAEVDGLVRRIDGVGDRIEAIASGGAVAFRLGATASAARSLVPRALRSLQERQTRPDLFFDVLSVDQIVDYLLDGTGQCVVTLAPIDHPMLTAEPLGTGQLVAVIPVGHPLAERRALTKADLADIEIISFQVDGPHQRAIRSFLGEDPDARRTRTVVRFADTAVAMASEGMAVALVDSFTTLGPVGGNVVVRPLVGQEEAFSLYLQWNPNRPVSSHVDALRKLLIREVSRD